MKKSVTPCAMCTMGIAIAGAGVLLAIAPGEAQAAPVTAPPPLSPAISATSLFGSNFSPHTPNALLAATISSGTAANEPLYGLIGIAGEIPVVNIFIANGTNGAPGTGGNGGNAGELALFGHGGNGGAGGNGATGTTGATGTGTAANGTTGTTGTN